MLATVSSLADWTGLERRTIQRRLSSLPVVQTKGKANYYDSHAALRRIYRGPDDDLLDPGQERAKRDKAATERDLLRIDREVGLLVERTEVDLLLRDFAAHLQALLANLPGRLVPALLPRCGEHTAMHATIEQFTRELLNDLADRIAAQYQRRLGKAGDA